MNPTATQKKQPQPKIIMIKKIAPRNDMINRIKKKKNLMRIFVKIESPKS